MKEIFVGDKVLVELDVKQIIESKNGVSYVLARGDSWSTVEVVDEDIKDVVSNEV